MLFITLITLQIIIMSMGRKKLRSAEYRKQVKKWAAMESEVVAKCSKLDTF
jgi:hypothetical protein